MFLYFIGVFRPIQHKNIATTLQKYFIAKLQHCKNIAKYCCNISVTLQQRKNKMSVLKILIHNVAAILQHNIYAILGFAHNGGILAVLLQKHYNNAATLL